MKFMKKYGFILLIFLPIIPIGILITSIERFTGIDAMLRLYVSIIALLVYFIVFFLGIYFNRTKHILWKSLLGVVAFLLLAGSSYFAFVMTHAGIAISNIADSPNVRYYSLVVREDFDLAQLNGLTTVGVALTAEEEVIAGRNDFLVEQNFIPNPVVAEYDSPIALLTGLLENEKDAIIIKANFVQVFEELEGLEELEALTRVLDTFSVELVERDIADIDPTEPFSILILGLNTAGELFTGQINVFMLLTVNIEELTFTLTSVPRDSFIWTPCLGYDKLAHANVGGAACALGAVENLFDMNIDHYVMMNFTGFMDIIDVLGGIEVDVPITFSEQDSRRRFGEHMIHLEAGLQTLNGEQALALSRHRGFLDGDFTRMGNQQLVLNAMFRTMFERINNINDFLPLLSVLGENVDTSLSAHNITAIMQHLLEVVAARGTRNIMDELHLMTMTILGGNASVHMHGINMSIVHLFTGMVFEARHLMMVNLGLEEPVLNFTFEFDGFNLPRNMWLQIIAEPRPPHLLPPDYIAEPEYIPEIEPEPEYSPEWDPIPDPDPYPGYTVPDAPEVNEPYPPVFDPPPADDNVYGEQGSGSVAY